MSYFYTVLGTSQILGSFLAAGFVQLRGLNGLAGWRYLFGFEGLITGVIGIISFFMLAPSPTNTAGILRGKNGWFNEREEKILVNRVLRDDPTKGDMNNREGVSLKGLWAAIREKDLWPVYMLGREYMCNSGFNGPLVAMSNPRVALHYLTFYSSLHVISHSYVQKSLSSSRTTLLRCTCRLSSSSSSSALCSPTCWPFHPNSSSPSTLCHTPGCPQD